MGTNVLIKLSVLKNSTLSFDGSIFIDKTYPFSSKKKQLVFCSGHGSVTLSGGQRVWMDGECL